MVHSVIQCLTLVLFSTTAQLSLADDAPKNTELVKALSQYVVVLNRPIYVYNWFNSNGHRGIWSGQFSADSEIGYQHFVSMANMHFGALCTGDANVDSEDCTTNAAATYGNDNMFGPGLYASVDPVATAQYGQGNAWDLMQIHLPKGFRVASLLWNVQTDMLSDTAISQLKALGCNFNTEGANEALTLLVRRFYNQNPGYGQDYGDADALKSCAAGVRHLLKDQLKIDGFYYSYNASTMNECDKQIANGGGIGKNSNGNDLRQGAFVITSPDRIQATDVEVFNSQSTDDTPDRVRISTLFYKASGRNALADMSATIKYYNDNGIPNYPNYTVRNYAANGCYTENNVYACGDWYMICPNDSPVGDECTYVPLTAQAPAAQATPMITAQTFPRDQAPAGTLLWSDLDGQPQDPAISPWIKDNLLGCSDVAPYGRVPNLRYGRFYPAPVTPNQ